MSKVNFSAQVTIDEAKNAIILFGKELTPIIQSEPGCGKSSILKAIETELGDAYDYIYVDCPVKDMSDIAMTIPNHQSHSLEYYVSSLFKLDNPKPKVIMLDEMMKAPKLLQIIFTRLTLERMIGDVKLPEGSIVFATSNNSSDGEMKSKKRKIYESTIEKAREYCKTFKDFNLGNSELLEQASISLEKALDGVSADDIRESDAVRNHVKDEVDSILSKFGSFSI